MSDNYSLILPFISDDYEFIFGFEAGRVYQDVRGCGTVCVGHSFTVHAENAEMMLRIAEATGHVVRSEEFAPPHESTDDWIEVEFSYLAQDAEQENA